MDAPESPPDLFLVSIVARGGDAVRALRADAAIDFGCRPRLRPLGGGAVELDAFVDEAKVRELETRGDLAVTVRRNASEEGRARQREVGGGDRFDGGAVVPRGFGAKVRDQVQRPDKAQDQDKVEETQSS